MPEGGFMRYALRVFYDGRDFYGSQRQPDKRTVEDELLRAFSKLEASVEGFQAAGRTDRGVSALGNVYAVTTGYKLKARALNFHLPGDIKVLAVRRVHDDFKARKEALERTYKYFLPNEGYAVDSMMEAADLLTGKNSYHNFSAADNRRPVKRLKEIDIHLKKGFLVITFRGDSFLWQMVRRLATALAGVGRGELTLEDIEKYLDPKVIDKVPPMPAENLVLWNVGYAFEFEPEDYSLKRLREELETRIKGLKTNLLMGEEMLEGIKHNID